MMDQYAICYILLDLVVVDLLLCIILYVGLGDNFMTDTEKTVLEKLYDELCAELSTTQLNCDMWHDRAEDMRNRLSAAQVENAKLRELSSIMLKCIMAEKRKKLICWECPMHKQFDELRSYCCLEHEAKKLGVGVD